MSGKERSNEAAPCRAACAGGGSIWVRSRHVYNLTIPRNRLEQKPRRIAIKSRAIFRQRLLTYIIIGTRKPLGASDIRTFAGPSRQRTTSTFLANAMRLASASSVPSGLCLAYRSLLPLMFIYIATRLYLIYCYHLSSLLLTSLSPCYSSVSFFPQAVFPSTLSGAADSFHTLHLFMLFPRLWRVCATCGSHQSFLDCPVLQRSPTWHWNNPTLLLPFHILNLATNHASHTPP